MCRFHRAYGCGGLGELVSVIAAAARRTLDIHGARCFCVGRDEVGFLRLVGLMQRGHTEHGVEVLASWLPPAAVRLATNPARKLAVALAGKALIVPLRHPHMTMPIPGHLAHANAGLMLVQ